MPNGRMKKAPTPPENTPSLGGDRLSSTDRASPTDQFSPTDLSSSNVMGQQPVEKVLGSRQTTGTPPGQVKMKTDETGARQWVEAYHGRFFGAGPQQVDQFMNSDMVRHYPKVQQRALQLHQQFFKKPYTYKKR